jgi:two-component system response regulator VicR
MSGKRVLIIDDDADIQETTGSLLTHEGFEVSSAETVERGIQMIEEVKPDIVLLDIMFPEKKTRGFEAASEIKEKHPDLPIIALTAINREYSFDFVKEDIQAEEFVNKPIDTPRLVELIRKHT